METRPVRNRAEQRIFKESFCKVTPHFLANTVAVLNKELKAQIYAVEFTFQRNLLIISNFKVLSLIVMASHSMWE